MQPRLLATAAMAVEQANKLGVSNNKNIITVYKNHQLISINRQPLIVNMIANANANTGMYFLQLIFAYRNIWLDVFFVKHKYVH